MSVTISDEDYKKIHELVMKIREEAEKLKQENAILREALAVYANKHNWEYDDKSKEHCIFSPVGYNFDLCSELAQKALEETK